MRGATTMTTKGQVTVPREIRDRLGLEPGDKMAFTMLSDGTVIIRPQTRRLADLAGSLTRPGQPKVAIEDMNPVQGADRSEGGEATGPMSSCQHDHTPRAHSVSEWTTELTCLAAPDLLVAPCATAETGFGHAGSHGR